MASLKWVLGVWAQVFKLPWQVLCTHWAISSALGNIFSTLTFLLNKGETQEQCRKRKVAKTNKQADRHASFVRTCQGFIARHRQRWPTRREFNPVFAALAPQLKEAFCLRANLPRYNMIASLQGTCGPQSRGLFPRYSQRVRICDNSQHEHHQPRWLLLTSRRKHSVWSSFGERRDFSVCCPFQPDFAPCPLRCMLSFMCSVYYGIQEVRKVGSKGMLVLTISSLRKELTFETPSQSPSVWTLNLLLGVTGESLHLGTWIVDKWGSWLKADQQP